jgi:3'-phosphoadenosine 5'-phosphosulfate sulfotransferase (PAPS reductase)/FAD synthetase
MNCLVLLSGGKDSALCLATLKEAGLNVKGIHFTHRWGWGISTEEARRVADLVGTELLVHDITPEYMDEVAGKVVGRPCTMCKTIMDRETTGYCLENGFRWICSGDNAQDSSVAKIRRYEAARGNQDLFVTEYLDCVEVGIALPGSIEVLRPIIDMDSETVEQVLSDRYGIRLRKIHETGDKYKEYWREGCPLQYADSDVLLTPILMDDLFDLNSVVTEYAREHGIRASIHLPSRRIVTVPEGHEERVMQYLRDGDHII